MNRCPYCHSSYGEILQTGFVGCQRCYEEIDGLKEALNELYGDKKHKGRGNGGENGSI